MAKTHGYTGTLTYSRWKSMMQRCHGKNQAGFARYGGRGIKVCESWHDFVNFLADMGECPNRSMTVERADNDKHYESGNCRWATKAEQAANRPSHCVRLTHNGVTKNVADWARDTGLQASAIYARLRLKWPVERILTTPADGSPTANRHPKLQQITFNGETKSVLDWARALGIAPNTLRMRLRLGWTVKRALSRPAAA